MKTMDKSISILSTYGVCECWQHETRRRLVTGGGEGGEGLALRVLQTLLQVPQHQGIVLSTVVIIMLTRQFCINTALE